MRVLVGIDDTDMPGAKVGTARLTRMIEDVLPGEVTLVGVVGHQLFRGVPAPSHNKTSCAILDCPTDVSPKTILAIAVAHVEQHAARGSAAGIVVAAEVPAAVIKLGREACWRELAQEDARRAIEGLPVYGIGTGRGLIGAAAAVGLTAWGWAGRWLELGGLHRFGRIQQVSDLATGGIRVVSVEPSAGLPGPEDWVDTHDWLRPQLLGGQAVLPVRSVGDGLWEAVGQKKRSP